MAASKTSIIEVNGKKYDALTGRMIEQPKQKTLSNPRTINDFTRMPAPSKKVHKTTQRSQTLMRNGVKKPVPKPKLAVKSTKTAALFDIRPVSNKSNRPALSTRTDSERLMRANAVKQSRLVRKFGDMIQPSAKQPVAQKVQALPVVQAPMQHGAIALSPPRSRVDSLIERGLKNATAHKAVEHQTRPKKTRRRGSRLATYGAGALSALLLVGFIAYQNMPNIAVRYASARSGITANLPGYQPSGFSLDHKVKYNPGHITLEYSSNSDDRRYTVTQRESNWNSETLMSNYVDSASEQVQRYEDKGRTIYLYGDSNATWVDGGIWYEIKGDSKLTSDQLIRIATSL